jgi:peptidyl-dipeptidase Dcp
MLCDCVWRLQEKWVYDNKTFNGFARHYKTGKPLPSDMFAKIQGSQTFRKGELQRWSVKPVC